MKSKTNFTYFLYNYTFYAQEKYYTKSGTIVFESSVASFEEVKATNTKVTAIFKTETGDIAALALVKAFRFKIALMEEHFNENYAESNKFPKAKFSGKIQSFQSRNLSKEHKSLIKGKLTFQELLKKLNHCNISNKNNIILFNCNFHI